MRAPWRVALIGVGATATMDLGAELIRRTTGVEALDYGLLGRWLSHMRRGRFAHPSIAAAPSVPNERKLGLVAHYAIGVGFAGLLVAGRPGWADRPTVTPAIVTGLGTTFAPWLVMQPAFGMGSPARRPPTR